MDPFKMASALRQIEDGKDMMRSSVELFWALFDNNPFEDLRNDAIARDIRDRESPITTADMTVLAVHDPDAFAARLPERLRELTERLTPPYQPDEPDDARSLFIAAHLRASRLALYLILSAEAQDNRLFGYGEDAGMLASELRSLIEGFKHTVSPGKSVLFPVVPSLWAIESLWARVDAALAEREGEYARALISLEQAQGLVSALNYARVLDIPTTDEELDDLTLSFPWEASEDPWTPMWLSEPELPAQTVIGWFEALKSRRGEQEWAALAITCDKLSLLTEVLSRGDEKVVDGEENSCDWAVFWQRAAGWAEAQLTSSESRNLIQKREHIAAEERLRAYFFDEAQWNALSERARDALVSADSAWMSANHGRPSLGRSIPNDLRKATEHILQHYLWDPVVRWADKNEQSNLDFRELRRVRARLAKLGHDPGLADYVGVASNTKETTAGRRTGILSDGGVVKYLQDHFGKKDADFIKNKVKKRLRMLKDLRDPEEHGKGASVHLSEIRDLYAEFMGIGRNRLAILPELVRILLQPPPK